MNGNDSLDFGARLRQFRRNAGLTQEELAGRANVSTRTISDLERGISQFPYRATVDQLAQALSLPPTDATVLRAAAQRRRGPRAEPRRAGAHLPQSSTPILGRDRDEAVARRLLTYPDVRLLTLTGVGGVGKRVSRSKSQRGPLRIMPTASSLCLWQQYAIQLKFPGR